MRYIISDIHGDKKSLLKMINLIDLDIDSDTLYVLGDSLDRGKYPLSTLDYLKSIKKCIIIKGNHELFCQMYLEKAMSSDRWCYFGGENTLRDIIKLSSNARMTLLDYLQRLPYYVETYSEILGKIILSHTGIHADYLEVYNTDTEERIDVIQSIINSVNDSEYDYLISSDLFYVGKSILKKLDAYMICGHVPTYRITNDNGIYRNQFYMDIDCGNTYPGGRLGCYCLDTGEEFYV